MNLQATANIKYHHHYGQINLLKNYFRPDIAVKGSAHTEQKKKEIYDVHVCTVDITAEHMGFLQLSQPCLALSVGLVLC